MKLDISIPFGDILEARCIVGPKGDTAQNIRSSGGWDLVLNTAIFNMATYKLLSRVASHTIMYWDISSPAWGVAFPSAKPPFT